MGERPLAVSLPMLIDEWAARSPSSEALVVGSKRYTYRQLQNSTEQAARGYTAIGVRPGDVVALVAANGPAWLPAAIGAMRCGARVDAFNTWAKSEELRHLLTTSQASVLVIQDRVARANLLGELRAVLPEIDTPGDFRSALFPNLRAVVVIGEEIPLATRSWTQLLTSSTATSTPNAISDLNDGPAFVVYTSGSATTPKAVPLCHQDLLTNGFHIGERMGLEATDRVWLGSPLFWSYGCANALMATFTHGACLVLQEKFASSSAAVLMKQESVTAAYLLPTMITSFDEQTAARIREITSLRTGLTIGRPEIVERAASDLGIGEICNIYGSTETYGNCCVTDRRSSLGHRMSTQGTVLPGVEIRIVDELTGDEMPQGEAGEAQVRGRVTPGYLDDEQANAAAFTEDGWFRTGDRLIFNSDGSYTFVDRIGDMIKTSGANVSPAEVESVLVGHPEVDEAMVVGAPHPTMDEVPVAFVITRSSTLSPETLESYCRDRLAGFKAPQIVTFVTVLPRTATGKSTRRALRKQATELVEKRLARDRMSEI